MCVARAAHTSSAESRITQQPPPLPIAVHATSLFLLLLFLLLLPSNRITYERARDGIADCPCPGREASVAAAKHAHHAAVPVAGAAGTLRTITTAIVGMATAPITTNKQCRVRGHVTAQPCEAVCKARVRESDSVGTVRDCLSSCHGY